MKKMFERLRLWLIKKLGGYTQQYAPVRQEIMRPADVPVRKLEAAIDIDMLRAHSAIDFRRCCECSVMELLMQKIYQSGFILWERCDDVIRQKVNMRATLYVVDANDLRPCFQWREN